MADFIIKTDTFCELGGNDYNIGHRLRNRLGKNPVSYATTFDYEDHTKVVWGGTGATTGGVDKHFTVRFQSKNPDSLFKNPNLLVSYLDFLLKDVDFIIK